MLLGSAASKDVILPVVGISSPANGATVSGNMTLQASGSDVGSGVASVQWKIDNVNVGAAQTVAPYTVVVDTTPYSDAAHTITAVITDKAGNTSSAAITVTVNNVPAGGNLLNTGPTPPGTNWKFGTSPYQNRITVPSYPGDAWNDIVAVPTRIIGNYKLQVLLTIGYSEQNPDGGTTFVDGYIGNHYFDGVRVFSFQNFNGNTVSGTNVEGWVDVPRTGNISLYWYQSGSSGETAYLQQIRIDYRYVRFQ
jgi:hypothetical protein